MRLLSKIFSIAFGILIIIGAIYFLTGENLITGNIIKEAKKAGSTVGDAVTELNNYTTESGIKEKARGKLDEFFYDKNDLIEDLFLLKEQASDNDMKEMSRLILKIDEKTNKFDDEELIKAWDDVLECLTPCEVCEDKVFLNFINIVNQQ